LMVRLPPRSINITRNRPANSQTGCINRQLWYCH
jgi:hypothetical protein